MLLILAGISIAMLSGDNSILNQAGRARDITGEKSIAERVQLVYLAALTEGKGDARDYLDTELEKEFGSGNYRLSSDKSKVEIDGKEYKFDGTTIEDGESSGGALTISLTKTGTPSIGTPPNPDTSKFVHVDGTTIENGYVIRDTTNGNEFVWVPVDKNQKLKLKVTASKDITSIKLIDPVGDEINLGTSGSIGKSFEKTNIEPTYNGVYKAEVTIGTEKTTETLLVRSLYAQDAFNDYFTDEFYEGDGAFNMWKTRFGNAPETQMYSIINSVFGGNVTNRSEFNAWAKSYDNPSSWTDTTTNPNTNLNYVTSVNTNGGFYIGRYEAGSTTKRTSGNASADGSTMNAPLSKSGVDTYNYVTRSQAIKIAEKMYSGKSYLITNAAWDRTLGWIINSNDKSLTISDVVSDSKSWGNYSDSSFTYAGTGSLAQTGAFGNNTKVNNIFDLAGNVYEWTSATSPDSSSPCVIRGGSYYDPGSSIPASLRAYSNETGFSANNCFRVALFL